MIIALTLDYSITHQGLKLLEGIGAMSGPDRKSAETTNFQDDVTLPIDREHDNHAAQQRDSPESELDGLPSLTSSHPDAETALQAESQILSAVEKVLSIIGTQKHLLLTCQQLRKIVRAVRSSPQRRVLWLKEVKLSLAKIDDALGNISDLPSSQVTSGTASGAMLILDVKTRWSSTHQMLRTFSASLDEYHRWKCLF